MKLKVEVTIIYVTVNNTFNRIQYISMKAVIKWTGSKRSQAEEILKYFPSKIDTYYEPFVGGGSIFGALMESGIKVEKFILSDLNKELIGIWNLIKDNPLKIIEVYKEHWNNFNKDYNNLDSSRKEYFNKVKNDFNIYRNPEDLFFLTRTAFSGLVRYNSRGEYNSPCHFSRAGINPERLRKIIMWWHDLMKDKNIEFHCCDYRGILLNCTEFGTVYLDPPYLNTSGIYFSEIGFYDFWSVVKDLKAYWLVSYNGHVEGEKNNVEIPKIFSEKKEIYSGKSSFRKFNKSGDKSTFETLYIK